MTDNNNSKKTPLPSNPPKPAPQPPRPSPRKIPDHKKGDRSCSPPPPPPPMKK